jgi:hypothetical protein
MGGHIGGGFRGQAVPGKFVTGQETRTSGAKAQLILNRFTARLKSCPDTKPSLWEATIGGGFRGQAVPGVPALAGCGKFVTGQETRTSGAKAQLILNRFTARLKSCPDTKPSLWEATLGGGFSRSSCTRSFCPSRLRKIRDWTGNTYSGAKAQLFSIVLRPD